MIVEKEYKEIKFNEKSFSHSKLFHFFARSPEKNKIGIKLFVQVSRMPNK